MPAVVQIVDGHGGPLVMDLNAWAGGQGALAQAGLNLTDGQLAAVTDSTVWSPLTGPAGLGRRKITVPVVLIGASADDLGTRIAKLMQATQAPWWLRIRRHNASADSWLQCYPCVPAIDSQITASAQAHMAVGTITADTAPYALGDRVDIPATAVSMNPAGNAWGLDINGVGGDTATPLLLRLFDPTAFTTAMGAFISVRRRQTPSNLTAANLSRQAEYVSNSLGNGTNVAVVVNATTDAAMSSGTVGVRATWASAATALDAGQIIFSAPALGGPDLPGVYRVFVRIRRNGTANTQPLVLKAFMNGALITPQDITVPAGGAAIRLVDLGLMQYPAAQPQSILAPVPNSSGAVATRVLLEFWRTDGGAATVDFDYMCWIPADEDAGYLDTDQSLQTPTAQYVVIDGYQHLAVVTNADPIGVHSIIGQSYGGPIPTTTWTGGAPRVRPGANRVFIVAGTGGVAVWPIAQSLSVAASYWPRYTWLR